MCVLGKSYVVDIFLRGTHLQGCGTVEVEVGGLEVKAKGGRTSVIKKNNKIVIIIIIDERIHSQSRSGTCDDAHAHCL